MSELRPVSPKYDPGYPRTLTEQEIEDLLRPNLFRRFGKKALVAAGAVVASMGLAGAALTPAQQPANAPALPKAGLSTNKDKMFREKVFKVAREILGPKVGFWDQHTSIHYKQDIKANPVIKYPHIAISFGNSYVGIFDTEKAKEATFKLFAEYGIKLEKDVQIKGDGYEFNADGYNKDLKIGFEIVLPDGPVGFGKQPAKFVPEPPERKLDAKELETLDKDIQAGKQRFFVVQGLGFPNMDGDQYTPLQYYLASVVDYLNWVHGDKSMEQDTILGIQKKVFQSQLKKKGEEKQK